MAHKTKALLLAVGVVLLSAVLLPAALAYETQPIDGNAEYTEDSTVLNAIQTGSQLGGYEDVAAEGPLLTAALIVNFLLTMLGAIAVALTVYAGFLWMIARGNEDDIKKAKDILAGSAIGLLLILSSYSITTYIFRSFLNITDF